jgi:hypothetical protein
VNLHIECSSRNCPGDSRRPTQVRTTSPKIGDISTSFSSGTQKEKVIVMTDALMTTYNEPNHEDGISVFCRPHSNVLYKNLRDNHHSMRLYLEVGCISDRVCNGSL